MRGATLLAGCLACAATVAAPARAEDCAERVAALVVNSLDTRPAIGRLVTETNGQTFENEMLMIDWGHYLNRPVAGSPPSEWALTYNGALFTSADEGATWSKARDIGPEEREMQTANIAAQAASVRNAVCGTETVDGVAYDTLEADMTYPGPNAFEIHSRYWVDPATGFVPKAVTRMKSAAFESVTTQTWELAPDLVLPTPD